MVMVAAAVLLRPKALLPLPPVRLPVMVMVEAPVLTKPRRCRRRRR
jgi:hypothetical protein